MTSLFPGPERAPQPAWNPDDMPEGAAMDFNQLLDWFTPNTIVCWIIMAINILVFVVMLMAGFNPEHAANQTMLKWGADFGPVTIGKGEWWRVITSEFIHMGFEHVGFNMFVLFQIGPFMERLLGHVGFLIVYLASGIAGAMCSLAVHPYVISAGASGAIFGLYGALVGFLILRRDSIPGAALSRLLLSAVIFLIYNAVFGILNSGTDLAAHGGGLAAGLICGLAVSNPLNAGFRQRRLIRAVAAGSALAVVLLSLGARLPRPIDLMEVLTRFDSVEKKILATYGGIILHAKWSEGPDLANRIQTEVMTPWSIERDSLEKLNGLPARQQRFITSLVTYMDSRQQAWKSLIEGLRTHNKNLVAWSFKQQAEAQSTLKGEMAAAQ